MASKTKKALSLDFFVENLLNDLKMKLQVIDEYNECLEGTTHPSQVNCRKSILILLEQLLQILPDLILVHGLQQKVD